MATREHTCGGMYDLTCEPCNQALHERVSGNSATNVLRRSKAPVTTKGMTEAEALDAHLAYLRHFEETGSWN